MCRKMWIDSRLLRDSISGSGAVIDSPMCKLRIIVPILGLAHIILVVFITVVILTGESLRGSII